MIRALILVLSLMLSIPAAAMPACHDTAPAPAHAAMSAEAHDEDQANTNAPATAPDAACMGCIPPTDWLTARMPARLAVPALPRIAAVQRLRIGQATAPALPPPRTV